MEKRAVPRFSNFGGRAALLPNNNTTINHDGLDNEVVPGAYAADVVGEGSEDVRACAVAAGD